MTVRGRRVRAFVALFSFLAGYGVAYLTGAHLIADDDTACGAVPLAGYQAVTTVEPATPPAVPQHCTLCHLLRQVNGAHVSAIAVVFHPEPAVLAPPTPDSRGHIAARREHRASRAPPALSLV